MAQLCELRGSQANLAEAIEDLGLRVRDAFGSEVGARVGAQRGDGGLDQVARGGPGTASSPLAAAAFSRPEPPPRELGDAVEIDEDRRPQPLEDVPGAFKDSAPPADSVITNVAASAQQAWSGAAEVPEPSVDTGVPEQVFYVPPFEEEVLPATSVAELTPSALDELLATEFGTSSDHAPSAATSSDAGSLSRPEVSAVTAPSETTQSPSPDFKGAGSDNGQVRVAPQTDSNSILDILLGTRSDDARSRADANATPVATTSDTPPAPPVAPSPSTFVSASPPPPPPPAPVFSETPVPAPTFSAPPPPAPVLSEPPPPAPAVSETPPSPSAFSAGPDVFTAEPDTPIPPPLVTEPAPSAPVFVVEESATVTPAPTPAPPPPSIDSAPVRAETVEPSGLLFREPPVTSVAAPTSLPVAAPMPSPEPAAIESPVQQFNGVEAFAPLPDTEDDEEAADEGAPLLGSAASMATEILSAAPEVAPTPTPGDPEEMLISQEVTLIARGRRRRFRLH